MPYGAQDSGREIYWPRWASALKQHQYDREILVALISYLRESSEDKRASVYAARLAELEPGIQQTAH